MYGQEDEPIILDKFSPILHLVQTIRDEAHRFAVTFHRTRRNAQRLTSELHEVPGVGPKTVEKLLRTFGSLERVRQTLERRVEQGCRSGRCEQAIAALRERADAFAFRAD